MTAANTDRNAVIIDLRKAGHSYSEIARRVGINPSRARQIYESAVRKEARTAGRAKPLLDRGLYDHGLSVRACNALREIGIKTVGHLLALGHENPEALRFTLKTTPNLGKVSAAEIIKLLAEQGIII